MILMFAPRLLRVYDNRDPGHKKRNLVLLSRLVGLMDEYQQHFLDLALGENALKFGSFTLKSGRESPYFFNAGLFCNGAALATLGRCYAAAIVRSGVEFDMLFGPAYKGIPFVAATAIALAYHHGLNVLYCFNRNDAKDHAYGLTLGVPRLDGRTR